MEYSLEVKTFLVAVYFRNGQKFLEIGSLEKNQVVKQSPKEVQKILRIEKSSTFVTFLAQHGELK